MPPVILPDSSVFINDLGAGRDPFSRFAPHPDDCEFATCGMVVTEVCRGVRNPVLLRRVRERLGVMVYIPTSKEIWERLTQLAGTLSGGEQQMLAMARALMARPSLLLLDEPSMGLSPVMVEKIFDVIRDISANGVTILLVEQNARLALQAADRGYVMDSGMITTSADAKTLLNDPAVRAAYLGE